VNFKVTNNAFSEVVSVHWHGQEMKETPWADGMYGVTQAGILPENNHTYTFTASTPGTHIYVGETDGLMGARGLKGTLIVHPKVDTRKDLYSEELLMQISDAWQRPDVCLTYDDVLSKPVCSPVDKVTFDGVWGDGSKHYPFPRYNVKPGKCYRLRMVGLMSQVSGLNISIESHKLKLLSVNGVDVNPLDVSSVMLYAGERYDFQLCATESHGFNLREKDFAITAEAPGLCDKQYLERTQQSAPHTCTFRAVLAYKGLLPPRTKKSAVHQVPPLDLGTLGGQSQVKALNMAPMLKMKADVSLTFYLGVSKDGKMYLDTERRSWSNPASPLLMTKGLECAEGLPIVQVPENASDVELIIENELDVLHVVHLHGSRVQLISTQLEGALQESDAPLLRDTIVIPGNGKVVARLQATNPGFWALHAMSANARLRGATSVLNILPSKQMPVPENVPTTICPSKVFTV